MSEFFFGVGAGKVPAARCRKIDRIAKKNGAAFLNPTLPGEGPRYWFAGPNRGDPFDQRLADAVFADLDAAGLTPIIPDDRDEE